jgi:hypothetical protein
MPPAAISVNKFHSYNLLKLNKIIQVQKRMITVSGIEDWKWVAIFHQAG